MTEHNPYILRIELEDFENETRYAEYQSFTVADVDSKYRLDINGYSGDAGINEALLQVPLSSHEPYFNQM
jgi:hypothetical protein